MRGVSSAWTAGSLGAFATPALVSQDEGMKLEVDCYSGYKAEEKPIRFRLDGHQYLIEEVLDQWYGPNDEFYKVRADDGNL